MLRGMFADPLLWVSLGVQFLLAFVGMWVAVVDAWAKKHRWAVLSAFVVLGLLGMGVTARQAATSAQESANLKNALGNLQASTSLNEGLQEQLLAQSQALVALAQQNSASNARIEKSARKINVEVQATHAKLLALSARGKTPASVVALVGITERLTPTMRNFEHDWKYDEEQMQLGKWETSHTTRPPTDQERKDSDYFWDTRINDLNDGYRKELFTTVSDARMVQQALLAHLPEEDRTEEDKHQEDFLNQFTGQIQGIRQSLQCCKGLAEFADYLDTLAKRAQTASGA